MNDAKEMEELVEEIMKACNGKHPKRCVGALCESLGFFIYGIEKWDGENIDDLIKMTSTMISDSYKILVSVI